MDRETDIEIWKDQQGISSILDLKWKIHINERNDNKIESSAHSQKSKFIQEPE